MKNLIKVAASTLFQRTLHLRVKVHNNTSLKMLFDEYLGRYHYF